MNPSAATGVIDAKRKPTVRVLIALIAIVAGLSVADWFLEKTEKAELSSEAKRLYLDGSRLLSQGKPLQAVDPLRSAHMIERTNEDYQLALIEALSGAGKLSEAETLMEDALQRDPDSGRVNLEAARLSIGRRRFGAADSYYHLAIYGEWPDHGDRRLQVRLELVDFLASHGEQKELMAELLPLEVEGANNPQILHKLAVFYLTAGSPARAAEVCRTLIHQNPKDADAYVALGSAELELGEYRAAQGAFLAALRHRPSDASIRERVEMASALTALDPTSRRLPSMEKYRRSLRVLQLTFAAASCLNKNTEAKPLLDAAQSAIAQKVPARLTNEDSEANLELAEKLWHARLKDCGGEPAANEEALRLIMEKLSKS